MVTRCFVGGPSFRFSLFTPLFLTVVALPVSLASQAPSPPQVLGEAESPKQAPKPAVPDADADAQQADPEYGKVVVDSVALRCWPGAVATPPVFEDTLKKDQVVQVGRIENGFRCVILPLGPLGYISKRFTTAAEDGSVTTKGTKVAFRYRPRTSEAPVAQMSEGTSIHVVALEDDWYKARIQGVETWVAVGDVQVVATDPAVIAAYEALGVEMQAKVQARLDAIAAERQRMERERVEMEAVQVVEAAFRQEMGKPIDQQQYKPLKSALAKVVAGLPDESPARQASTALGKRLETQQWIVDATAARNETPPVVKQPVVVEPPRDRLERFESIGWLRYEVRLASPGVYYIEKGGRRQYQLTCNTRRFDLSLFVGREVGVIGPRRTPMTDTLSTLDVERLEVLGTVRR